jgi:dienelactone hydrolase
MDNFRGETMDEHRDDFLEWTARHPYTSDESEGGTKIHPIKKDVDACLDYLSKNLGINPSNVAAIGFCWGVWALTKACAMGTPFRCAVGFHPSLRFEEMFGGDVVAMTKTAARSTPLFYCVSGNDAEYLKPPNGEVSVVLSTSGHGNSGDEKVCPRCVEFPEMFHGWVSRGDTSVNKVKHDAEMALSLATDFLRHWM